MRPIKLFLLLPIISTALGSPQIQAFYRRFNLIPLLKQTFTLGLKHPKFKRTKVNIE